MEHEAFVPFPVETVRRALAEPDRVARCVAGLQRDVDPAAGALAGRLRLRIGGSTITYRGNLRIGACDGGFEVEGEATEARGTGAVKLALVIDLEPVEGGTRLAYTGAVEGDGRLMEYDEATAATAGRRLLDRFSADLVTDLAAEPPAEPVDDGSSGPPAPRTEGATDAAAHAGPGGGPDQTLDGGFDDGPDGGAEDGVDEGADDDEDIVDGPADGELSEDDDELDIVEVEVPETVAGLEDDPHPDHAQPPAEAAHARRTMIGRSAEEVDHAPPRGRYAPVPAPETGSAAATLRWAAPAAAALLASAVVVGRVLRRRR